MDIADWRKKIDELDRRLVELLSQRAQAAQEIGRLKRNTSLPVYEPERIMDVMRNIQKEEIVPRAEAGKREGAETELEPTD
jgi:chorismate mutase